MAFAQALPHLYLSQVSLLSVSGITFSTQNRKRRSS